MLRALAFAVGVMAGAGPFFEDVTAGAGVAFRHREGTAVTYLPETLGAGAAVLDYDRDGYDDLFFVQGGEGPCVLYRNRGDGRFDDATAAAGAGVRGHGMGCAAVDADADGDADVVVTRHDGAPALLENAGDGTFAVRTLGERHPWLTSASALDADRDGLPEIYLCGYQEYGPERFVADPPRVPFRLVAQPISLSPYIGPAVAGRLMARRGRGWRDVARAWRAGDAGGKGLAAVGADLDGDGWPELAIANDVTRSTLLRNARGRRFEDVSAASGFGEVAGSMGVAIGDVDHDGRLDLAVTRWVDEPQALFAARGRPGRPAYVNASEPAGLAALPRWLVGWGVAFVDLDLDAWEDLAIVAGHTFQGVNGDRLVPQPMVLMRNMRGRFEAVALAAGDPCAAPRVGRGLAVGDVDRDGRADLVVTANNGGAALLRARGEGAWIALELVGAVSCRDALGARVEIEAAGTRQLREVACGGSYLSSGTPVVLAGIGGARSADVTVRWPRGAMVRYPGVSAGRYHRLVEPGR